MNIIFGDAVNQLPDEYIVLELDTFLIKPIDQQVTTWCVVESAPVHELIQLDENKKLHSSLMVNYRAQNWDQCLKTIESLTGLWTGELDSFYEELKKRIINFKQNPPEPGWNGLLVRNAAVS